MSALDDTGKRLGAAGAGRFAKWDDALYRDLVAGPGKRLWKRIAQKPNAAALLDAYLGLAVEAVGLGYIDRTGFDVITKGGVGASNLIALLWLAKLPSHRFERDAEVEIALLARAWNVGEGLLGEAPWLNRYVTAALDGLSSSIDDLETDLVTVLEPALTVRAPAAFRGPFAVSTIDTTDLDDEFLPGEMHLVAPAVLCVHDRKRQGVAAGVFLRPAGESGFLSLTPCLGERPPEDGAPAVELRESRLRIGEHRVALPLLKYGHRAVASRAGFCVASAVDSQRLWIVESP
jgi:hypothetical protein